MAFVNVCGKQIYYEEYGIGNSPTLVYMHGGPGESCRTYTYQARTLGERFHVISFDQYGVFRSEPIPEGQPAGVKYHVEMIEQMRIALGIESWIPLGHSFGGMLACLYAYLYPDRADAVIYDCPMWNVLLTAKTIAETTLPYYEMNGLTEQIDLCKEILDDCISPRAAFERAMHLDMNEKVQRYCHAIEMSDYHQYISEHIPQIDVPEECWYRYISFTQKLLAEDDYYENYLHCLAEISKPQLLIVGEYDMTCGKDQQAWFCEHSTDGRRVILENSAHLSWMQVPDRYTLLISEFAEEIMKRHN